MLKTAEPITPDTPGIEYTHLFNDDLDLLLKCLLIEKGQTIARSTFLNGL